MKVILYPFVALNFLWVCFLVLVVIMLLSFGYWLHVAAEQVSRLTKLFIRK